MTNDSSNVLSNFWINRPHYSIARISNITTQLEHASPTATITSTEWQTVATDQVSGFSTFTVMAGADQGASAQYRVQGSLIDYPVVWFNIGDASDLANVANTDDGSGAYVSGAGPVSLLRVQARLKNGATSTRVFAQLHAVMGQ